MTSFRVAVRVCSSAFGLVANLEFRHRGPPKLWRPDHISPTTFHIFEGTTTVSFGNITFGVSVILEERKFAINVPIRSYANR